MRARVSGAPGQVADHADVVADDDRGAAQFPGPHRGHHAVGVAGRAHSPTARDRRSPPCARWASAWSGRVLVRGREPLPGPDPDVGLVVVAAAHVTALAWPASMSAHICGNSGSVFAVVPMSSTSTPGTRSPTIAPAVAIRWSA